MIRFMDLRAFMDVDNARFRKGMREAIKDMADNEKAMQQLDKTIATSTEKINATVEKRVEVERMAMEKRNKINDDGAKERIRIDNSIAETRAKIRAEELKRDEAAATARQRIQERIDTLSDRKSNTVSRGGSSIVRAEQEAQEKITSLRKKAADEAVRIEAQRDAKILELQKQRIAKYEQLDRRRVAITDKYNPEGVESRYASAQARRRSVFDSILNEQQESGFQLTREYNRRVQSAKARLAQTFAEFTENEAKKFEQELRNVDSSAVRARTQRPQQEVTTTAEAKLRELSTKTAEEEAKINSRLSRFTDRVNQVLGQTTSTLDKSIATLQSRQNAITGKDSQALNNLREKLAKLTVEKSGVTNSITSSVDAINTQTNRIVSAIDTKLKTLRQTLSDATINRANLADEAELQKRADRATRISNLQDASQNNAFRALGAYGVARDIFSFGKEGADDLRSIQSELRNTNVASSRYQQITDLINATSLKTGRSVKELAISFREVENIVGSGSVGLNTWNDAQKVAISTGADLTSTARILAGAVKLYGETGLTSAQAANIYTQAARDSKLEFSEFAKVQGSTIGLAKEYGVSLTDTAATLVLFTNRQLTAEQSGTALRNTIQKMVRPTKETSNLLKQLSKDSGVNLSEAFSFAGLKANGFAGNLLLIREVANKLNLDAGQLAGKLFPDLRSALGGQISVKALDEIIAKSQEYNRIKNDSTFIEKSYADALSSTATQYDIADKAGKQLQQQVAIGLTPTIKTVAGFLTSLTNGTNSAGQGFVTFASNAALVTAALGVLGFGVRAALTGLAAFGISNPIGLAIVGGVAVITAGVYALSVATKQVSAKGLTDELTNAADAMTKTATRTQNLLQRLKDLESQQKLNALQERERITVLDELRLLNPEIVERIELQTTAYSRQQQIVSELTGATSRLQNIQAGRAKLDADIKVRAAETNLRNLLQDQATIQGENGIVTTVGLMLRVGFTNPTAYVKKLLSDIEFAKRELAQSKSEQAYYADPKNKIKIPESGSGNINTFLEQQKAAEKAAKEAEKLAKKNASQQVREFSSEVNSAYTTWLNAYEKYYVMTHGDTEYAKAHFLRVAEKSPLFGLNKKGYPDEASAKSAVNKLRDDTESIAKKEDKVKSDRSFHDLILRTLTNAENLANSIENSNFKDNMSKVDKFLGEEVIYNKKKYLVANLVTDESLDKLRSVAKVKDLTNKLVDEFEAADKSAEKAGKAFEKWIGKTAAGQEKESEQAAEFGRKLGLSFFEAEEKRVEKQAQAAEKIKEHYLRITGAFESIGEGDRDAFSKSLGIDPKASDPFGSVRAYVDNLYAIDKATKQLTETYSRLKSLQRQKKESTGISGLDAVLDDIKTKDVRRGYVTEFEKTFESAVTNGLNAGFTSKKSKTAINAFTDSLKSSLLQTISGQASKGIFDVLKNSGIFGQLFGDTKYNKTTEAAISNPASFVAALRSTVLNVNVVSGLSGNKIPQIPSTGTGTQPIVPTPPPASIPSAPADGRSIPQVPATTPAPTKSNRTLNDINNYVGYLGYGLAVNSALGNPVGRAGRYISNQLFGKKKSYASGQSRSAGNITMNNVTITSPTDAQSVANEVTRKAVVLGVSGAV